MPLYEYICDQCGCSFERLQSFHEAPLEHCPTCGGLVRRVIAPVGVIFKGSGWYITDSRRQLTSRDRPALSDRRDGHGKSEAPASTNGKGAAAEE